LQLNQQGLQAEILSAVKRAELRKKNHPVNIVEIWQSFEYNASIHSSKFKCILFDLYKQEEVIADDTLTYWTTNAELLRGPQNNDASPFQRCNDLLARKFPNYEFDSIHRIVPKALTENGDQISERFVNFEHLKSTLLSKDMANYDASKFTERAFLDQTINLRQQNMQVAI